MIRGAARDVSLDKPSVRVNSRRHLLSQEAIEALRSSKPTWSCDSKHQPGEGEDYVVRLRACLPMIDPSVLRYAIQHCSTEALKLYVECIANIFGDDIIGTYLVDACIGDGHDASRSNVDFVELLLERMVAALDTAVSSLAQTGADNDAATRSARLAKGLLSLFDGIYDVLRGAKYRRHGPPVSGSIIRLKHAGKKMGRNVLVVLLRWRNSLTLLTDPATHQLVRRVNNVPPAVNAVDSLATRYCKHMVDDVLVGYRGPTTAADQGRPPVVITNGFVDDIGDWLPTPSVPEADEQTEELYATNSCSTTATPPPKARRAYLVGLGNRLQARVVLGSWMKAIGLEGDAPGGARPCRWT